MGRKKIDPKDRAKPIKGFSGPVGELCRDQMDAIVAYRLKSAAAFNKTDLVRELVMDAYQSLPKEYKILPEQK